jgi:hypothetical protein
MGIFDLKNSYFLVIPFFILVIGSFAVAQDNLPQDTVLSDSSALEVKEIALSPAANVSAKDKPDDAGGSIEIFWELSIDDFEGGKIDEYRIHRSTSPDGPFEEVGTTARNDTSFTDNAAETGTEYFYKIVAYGIEMAEGETLWESSAESGITGPVKSSAQWFNKKRISIFVGIVILCGAIIYFITAAKGGKDFYIRKIAGIAEVENAVGRATEMGRAIYYVPGIHDMDDVQTLASMTILGKVAEIAAQNDTRIDVPVARSMVMVTATEIVKESYSRAGRPDAYQKDQVRYLTDDQFGYAAAIDGLFVREEPATVFLMGAFFAESLIMAETGNSIGAIQIAGTAQPAQLPFFVAACDYTLIGEEMFAASAYLSREPKLLGSLKGQDLGKTVFLIAIFIGIILESFGIPVSDLFSLGE